MINIFDRKTSYKEALISNGVYDLTQMMISAETTEDIYGNYELNMEIELQGDAPTELYEMLQVDNIIKVNDEGSEELFRIAQVNKGLEFIEVYCRHITISDSLNLWLNNVRPTNMNGNAALQHINQNTTPKSNLIFSSNIAKVSTANYVRKNLYEALFDGDNSFIKRWGGEVKRSKQTIRIDGKLGQDKSEVIKIKEALNLTGFNANSNIDEVSTVIYPVGFDGISAPRVESPLISNYSMEFPIEIKYEDVKVKKQPEEGQTPSEQDQEGYDTLQQAQAELTRRAKAEFTEKHLDRIKFECDIDYIDLERYEEYKDLTALQTAFLGDIISVRVDTFDMDIKARVVARQHDILRNRRIKQTISTEGTLKKPESIKDIIKDIIGGETAPEIWEGLGPYVDQMIQQGFKNGYLVYDKNACYAVDQLPKEKARNVVVLNKNGLGYSSTGIGGPYTYGFTIDGKLNADMITTGTLHGQYIGAGTIEANKLSVAAKKEITKDNVTTEQFIKLKADVDGITSNVGTTTSEVKQLKTNLESYKTQSNQKFQDLESKQSNFEKEVNGIFRDGVIDEAEAKILKDRLVNAEVEKTKVDDEYSKLYQHPNLEGTTEKTKLSTSKSNFDKAYSTLINKINSVIADNKVTEEEQKEVDTATSNFKEKLGLYKETYTEALNRIGQKYAAESLAESKKFTSSEIKQTSDSITQKVTRLEQNIKQNTTDISQAQQQITPDAIVSTVTKSETYIDAMTGKADKKTLISEINQSAEGIKIKASKVEIEGDFITKSDLVDGETRISGSNIKTGTIDSMKITGADIQGTKILYMAAGGTMACDGNTYIKNFRVPETRSGWKGTGTFSCGPIGYFDKSIRVKDWARVQADASNPGWPLVASFDKYGKWLDVKGVCLTRNGHGMTSLIVKPWNNDNEFWVEIHLSDKNMKENIKPLDYDHHKGTNKIGLDLVNSIKHCTYNFIGYDSTIECGYIAQDLYALNDQIVEIIEEGQPAEIYKPRLDAIMPNITLAIQQQQKHIVELEKRIATLEAKQNV